MMDCKYKKYIKGDYRQDYLLSKCKGIITFKFKYGIELVEEG